MCIYSNDNVQMAPALQAQHKLPILRANHPSSSRRAHAAVPALGRVGHRQFDQGKMFF